MRRRMRRTWMGVVLVSAMLGSGCATIGGGAPGFGGTGSGGGHAATFQAGPVYAMGGSDHHSLSDPDAWRPSPGGPVGTAKPLPVVGPEDTPIVEVGRLGIGVKGFPTTELQRMGLNGYLKSWAESGLGRSHAEMSQDYLPIWVYAQLKIFPGGGTRLLSY